METARGHSTARRASLLLALLGVFAAAIVDYPSPAEAKTGPAHRAAKFGVKAKIAGKTLTVSGNRRANSVTLRLPGKRGKLFEVDVRSNGKADFRFKRRLERIVVRGGGGNDSVRVVGADGRRIATKVPSIVILGGVGNDALQGGRAVETIGGGAGTDSIDGGPANDTIRLGGGDDTYGWDPGDGTDVIEGQGGVDRILFNGSGASERFELAPRGDRLRLTRLPESATLDANDVEAVELDALGGTDTVALDNLAGTGVTQASIDLEGIAGGGSGDGQPDNVVVNAGNGDDTIAIGGSPGSIKVAGVGSPISIAHATAGDALAVNAQSGADAVDASGLLGGAIALALDGGAQVDKLIGSPAGDLIDGGSENDAASLGDGDDTYRWDSGDGSDLVDGQAGTDRLLVNGSDAGDAFELAPTGGRLRLLRGPENVTAETNGVEAVDVLPLGGPDTVTVNDLAGTGVAQVNLDLTAAAGGSAGDGQVDRIVVNALPGNDKLAIAGGTSGVKATGLAAAISVTHSEEGNDELRLNALAGEDDVDASGLTAGAIGLTLDGGTQPDDLSGSAGNDLVDGGTGEDLVLLGAGEDVFFWEPGDGSDTVEGQSGSADTLLFNASAGSESVDLSANAGRLRLFRNVGNVTIDANAVERVEINVIGGADTLAVNDLAATDVTQTEIDLAAAPNGAAGDGQPDSVIVNGTASEDVVVLTGSGSSVSLTGLNPLVVIAGAEPANDHLTVNALGGDDDVDASAVAAGSIALSLNGGNEDDVLIGGGGSDTITGGDGDDVLIGGPGADLLDGGAGSNLVIQD